MSHELESRIAALSAEIRHYPTPIARCDEQLTELLDRRAQLLAELEQRAAAAPPSGCTPESIWINDGGFNAAQSA